MLGLWLAMMAQAQDVKVLDDSRLEEGPGIVQLEGKRGEAFQVGLVRATDTNMAPGVIIVEKYFDELCVTPCTLEMPAGWHEITMQDQQSGTRWYRRIRVLPGQQHFRLQRVRPGAVAAGVVLSAFIVGLPVGIPLIMGSDGSVKRTPKL